MPENTSHKIVKKLHHKLIYDWISQHLMRTFRKLKLSIACFLAGKKRQKMHENSLSCRWMPKSMLSSFRTTFMFQVRFYFRFYKTFMIIFSFVFKILSKTYQWSSSTSFFWQKYLPFEISFSFQCDGLVLARTVTLWLKCFDYFWYWFKAILLLKDNFVLYIYACKLLLFQQLWDFCDIWNLWFIFILFLFTQSCSHLKKKSQIRGEKNTFLAHLWHRLFSIIVRVCVFSSVVKISSVVTRICFVCSMYFVLFLRT